MVRVRDVEDHWLDAVGLQGHPVAVAPYAGEDVEAAPGQFPRGGRADAGRCPGYDHKFPSFR